MNNPLADVIVADKRAYDLAMQSVEVLRVTIIEMSKKLKEEQPGWTKEERQGYMVLFLAGEHPIGLAALIVSLLDIEGGYNVSHSGGSGEVLPSSKNDNLPTDSHGRIGGN